MRNYVEETNKRLAEGGIEALDYPFTELKMLYEKSGKEQSPLFPFLNYAAMCGLKKDGTAVDDYNECKQKGIECMKEYIKCVTRCKGSHMTMETSLLTCNQDGSITETKYISEVPFHEAKLTVTEPAQATRTIDEEAIDEHTIQWAADLLMMMTAEVGKQFDKYTERLDSFPTLEEAKDAAQDEGQEPSEIDKVKELLHKGKLKGLHIYKLSPRKEQDGTENNGYLIASAGKTVKTLLVMGNAVQYNEEKKGVFEPRDGKTRTAAPVTPHEKEQALQLHASSLEDNRRLLDAIVSQRQTLLDICGMKEGINECDIF